VTEQERTSPSTDSELSEKLDDAADKARKPDATQTVDQLEDTVDDAAANTTPQSDTERR